MKSLIFLIAAIFIFQPNIYADVSGKSPDSCTDSSVVTETELSPQSNLLSIPAREVEDKYVYAVSYFNSKMNIILRENVVSEFTYHDVPYYIYVSFMNAPSKKDYWKQCIKDRFSYEVVY